MLPVHRLAARHLAAAALLFTTVSAPALAADSIRVLAPTWPGFAPAFVAMDKGYFKELGLTVDMKFEDDRANVMAAMARGDTLDALFPEGFPGTELEHASLLETSLMLLLRPDLVDMDKVPSDGPAKFPTYDRYPVPEGFVPASGVLARAQGSSAEKGQLLLDDHVARITKAVQSEFGA
ncbi:creatininase family protein [Azospirillum canadense]|uniref:creatininase family protein n=1 Tax=Azospirillum canadense TaxID=403962 RepID=UPI0022272E00|nr:creatininase family protein [Azospirillum canadense]MCW2238850.1 creatinine amidohydrolase/Fe(II)-dependent formamide hydrolase-like protein [Azospirillum canadense]